MTLLSCFWSRVTATAALLCSFGVFSGAGAADLDSEWRLDPEASKIAFQSVKNGTKVETSEFAVVTGAIAPGGAAEVKIALDSIDTGIDLRNVRMRFLFFETFKFPEATITAQLNAGLLDDLPDSRRITTPIVYSVDLHGIRKELEIDTSVTLVTDELVLVSGSSIVVPVADFDLEEGLLKLQDAAKVTITPAGTVSFDLIFKKVDGPADAPAPAEPEAEPVAEPEPVAAAEPAPEPEPEPVVQTVASNAIETAGAFSEAECVGRFEILSRAGAIYFASGSARLAPESAPLLATLTDVINRCPDLDITIAGHTDSDGGSLQNLRLSEDRAASVLTHLLIQGVPPGRLQAVGYGESQPVAPNDTRRNKRLNRRIEFLTR